ncbi:hypothetical protein NIES4106_62040 (plasmid) [Fischerella sp. NIES-4106]|nr:hypothetical protein NIES4106_62040 [Fischerella sp. NIES-4106]
MKLTTPKSNVIGFSLYVTVLFCGSYYLSSNYKNLNPALLGMGASMAIGGGVLAVVKK